jgi:hypothetical protein
LKAQIQELKTALETLAAAGEDKAWRKAVALAAKTVAESFDVGANDVAILVRTADNLRLKFEHPPKLSTGINVFPVVANSMAGEVARTSRGLIENAFALTKHLAFYERILDKDEKATTIQKMMSVPVRADGACFAVVQVSRKGESAAAAGPDFSPMELGLLLEICDAIAPALKRLQPKIP